MVLIERMFMAKSIAAKTGMRNRFERLFSGCRFYTSWHIVKAGSPVYPWCPTAERREDINDRPN
jgi:hypothetical protein